MEHEAWTRRMQPPKGQRTRPVRGPAEDVPIALRCALVDRQEGQVVPDRGEPEHRADDPRAGTASTRNRGREDRSRPGQRPIPPRQDAGRPLRAGSAAGAHHTDPSAAVRARPHNPVEHVWNAARNNIANIQREIPEETFGASASYIAGRTFDYDFEHLPAPRNQKRFCFMTAIHRHLRPVTGRHRRRHRSRLLRAPPHRGSTRRRHERRETR